MGERLTKRVVDAAKPGAKDTFIWDTETKGFGLKITRSRKTSAGGEAGGKKVYIFQDRVRGDVTKTRITIGPHGAFTADQAREKAEELNKMFKRGIRPSDLERAAEEDAERQRQEAERQQAEADARKLRAFSAVADRYFVARVRKQVNGKTVESLIRSAFVAAWNDRDIATLGRRDVVAVVDGMVAAGKPGAAREALKRIRPLFAFAVGKEDIATNPAEGIELDDKYVPRARALSDPELVEVWKAAETMGYPFGPMVKLLILTGQRRTEVAEARWDEIDHSASTWTIPGSRTKNGKTHIVHLSEQAMTVIAALPHRDVVRVIDGKEKVEPSPFLLTTTGTSPVSGFSKAKASLDTAIAAARQKAAGGAEAPTMPCWTFHDFRRSFATGGACLGIAPHIIEKAMNHNPAALKGVAGIYNRFEYLPERKAALETWGRHVEMIVAGAANATNVVPIRA